MKKMKGKTGHAETPAPLTLGAGKRRASRFSLIELLVVGAIIALLAGILVPALSKSRASARRTECRNNLRGIGQAIFSYLTDSKDLMPVAAQMPSVDTLGLPRLSEVLNDHLDNKAVFRCPSDNKNYFEVEGSSYEYNMMLGGRTLKDILGHHLKNNTFLMFDYEPFHGKAGQPGSTNYLFIDGRVSDLAD